jgi:DNA-binding ferritin-like protein
MLVYHVAEVVSHIAEDYPEDVEKRNQEVKARNSKHFTTHNLISEGSKRSEKFVNLLRKEQK